MELSAKSTFLKIAAPEQLVQLSEFLNSAIFRMAAIHTTSQLAESKPSQEAMIGAMEFRRLLMDIATPKINPPPMPQKNLKEFPDSPSK